MLYGRIYWKNDPHYQINPKTCGPEEQQQEKDNPQDIGVNVQIHAQTAANACDS